MKDYLTVAKIVKPQGIRGEVKVMSFTDTPADLQAFERVYIGGNPYKILKVRPQAGECAYLTLSSVADRNAAETLRGLDVEVKREDIPAPADGRVYIADLIGCRLVDGEGNELGKLTDITPARTDIYEYEKPDGKKMLFAAAEGVILSIEAKKGEICVDAARLAEVCTEE